MKVEYALPLIQGQYREAGHNYCGCDSVTGFVCTREDEHSGPHAAHASDRTLVIWEYREEDPDLRVDEGL